MMEKFTQLIKIVPMSYKVKIKSGQHVNCSLAYFNNHAAVIKTIGPKYQTKIDKQSAEQYLTNIVSYQDKLRALGINTPDILSAEVQPLPGDTHKVIICNKYIENELDITPAENVIDLFVQCLSKVFKQATINKELPVSVELNPSNVCIYHGELYYIDLTPPLISSNNLLVLENEKHLKKEWKRFQFFHKLGVLFTFFTKTSLYFHNKREYIMEKTIKLIDNDKELKDSFTKAITELSSDDINVLNENDQLAMRAKAIMLINNKEELQRFFETTASAIWPNLDLAKGTLLKYVR